MKSSIKIACLAAATMASASSFGAQAVAGPCSDQIATVARTLNGPDVTGTPTTGTLNGSGPNNATTKATAPDRSAQADATSAKGKLGGDAGNRDMTAAASGVATSPEDVRRQQAGVGTTADAPNTPTPKGRLAQAMAQLNVARALDAKGDTSCHAAADKAAKMASN